MFIVFIVQPSNNVKEGLNYKQDYPNKSELK